MAQFRGFRLGRCDLYRSGDDAHAHVWSNVSDPHEGLICLYAESEEIRTSIDLLIHEMAHFQVYPPYHGPAFYARCDAMRVGLAPHQRVLAEPPPHLRELGW